MRKIEVMKVREILRLKDLGLNVGEKASSCGCGKSTVSDILNRARESGIENPDGLTDKQLMSGLL